MSSARAVEPELKFQAPASEQFVPLKNTNQCNTFAFAQTKSVEPEPKFQAPAPQQCLVGCYTWTANDCPVNDCAALTKCYEKQWRWFGQVLFHDQKSFGTRGNAFALSTSQILMKHFHHRQAAIPHLACSVRVGDDAKRQEFHCWCCISDESDGIATSTRWTQLFTIDLQSRCFNSTDHENQDRNHKTMREGSSTRCYGKFQEDIVVCRAKVENISKAGACEHRKITDGLDRTKTRLVC